MRVLFITPRFPYPPHRGDQSVAFHRIRTLAGRHEITLVTLYENEKELEGLPELEKYCHEIHCFHHSSWKGIRNVALYGGFSRLPLQVLYFKSRAMEQCLKSFAKGPSFDLVHGVLLRMAPYLQSFKAPRLLDLNDSMVLNVSRQVEVMRGPKKWFYQHELSRLRSFEARLSQFSEKVILVSELDRTFFPGQEAAVIPLGVEEPQASPLHPQGEGPIIAFSGNMDYAPNQDAVRWFLESCWEELSRVFPKAQFWVIGRHDSPVVRSFGNIPGCKVWGFVPDLMAILQQAHLAIAPMQTGSGMQFKILEAMACGLPVVTSTLGMGTIKVTPGQELFVADSPEAMIETATRLWMAPELRERVGREAQAFVRRNHTWEASGDRVDAIYQELSTAATAIPSEALP